MRTPLHRHLDTLRSSASMHLDLQQEAPAGSDDVRALAACIRQNVFCPDFDLGEARHACGTVSEAAAARFEQEIGRTPAKHLEALRLAAAVHLLLTTAAPVNVIALAVGYTRVETFLRRFKNAHDAPPGRWRKEHTAERGDGPGPDANAKRLRGEWMHAVHLPSILLHADSTNADVTQHRKGAAATGNGNV